MNIEQFQATFEAVFPATGRNQPTRRYEWHIPRPGFLKRFGVRNFYLFESLRDVEGLVSIKKEQLLRLAYGCLGREEAYLEVGTWQGRSLIAAMHGNAPRPTFGCDDFSESYMNRKLDLHARFLRNIRRHGLERDVTFYKEPFQTIFTKEKLPIPIGLYFYDAAHDEQHQYLGIKLVEPFLNDEALVIVDDWRFAPDSQSYAKAGTQRAVAESSHGWRLLHELPARRNCDRAMWWNGVAVYAFHKKCLETRKTTAPIPAAS